MTKILVVDDCEEISDVIQALLSEQGYEVELANDRDEAFNKLGKEKFDLVMCDLVMPLSNDEPIETEDSAMVGVHCINEITKTYPDIPVIAISGELVGAPLEAVKNFGACSALSKPFGRAELLGVIDSVLGKAR